MKVILLAAQAQYLANPKTVFIFTEKAVTFAAIAVLIISVACMAFVLLGIRAASNNYLKDNDIEKYRLAISSAVKEMKVILLGLSLIVGGMLVREALIRALF